ncbi:MAG: phytanoyl-CoA dioxygenase family protein, partial [Halobaculum sp.]
LGPIRACSPSAAREFVETFETEVLGSESDDREASPRHDRHLDSRSVYEFLTQSSIVETIRSIYGSDLLLWSSHFWEKEPGEEGVPWHQERHFSAVEPPVTATIDLALDPVDETSGCMGVIPGSHERAVPHTEADGAESQGYVDSRFVEEAETVRIGLDPGEFVLYNARLLHRTYANETDRRRRSLSCRMTIPEVRIDSESPLLYSGHQSVVVSGTDGHGLNETTEPPASGSDTDR